DWLLLTKRPQNYRRLVPAELLGLPNVWPGTTVESADYAWRADALLNLACAGPRWVSYEPALGPLSAITGIDCYIVGGESGPVHRRMEVAWLEELLRGRQKAWGSPIREAGFWAAAREAGADP